MMRPRKGCLNIHSGDELSGHQATEPCELPMKLLMPFALDRHYTLPAYLTAQNSPPALNSPAPQITRLPALAVPFPAISVW